MDELNKYNLKINPFRLTPPSNSEEIVWAGFADLKKRIERRITLAIKIPNSCFVVNWGEYGSGKTHAARYFCKDSVLKEIAGNDKAIPFTLLIDFPRGKEPVKDIFVSIIDKLDFAELRKRVVFDDDEFKEALNQSTNNILIRNIIKLMFKDNSSSTLFGEEYDDLKGYLYGTTDVKQLKSKGIQRKLSTENDYTEFLAALFSFVTYNKKYYACVTIWFDEFENINTLGNANLGNVNNFLRTLIDKTPNNLLIFLNLTQSPSMKFSDLGMFLHPSVKSRIKDTIELGIPNNDALHTYFIELINNKVFRLNESSDKYFPFDKDVVDSVINDLGINSSLRQFNDVFSLLLDYAYESEDRITNDYYQSIKSEIIGWRD